MSDAPGGAPENAARGGVGGAGRGADGGADGAGNGPASELRRDPLTGTWTVIAPARGSRPRSSGGRRGTRTDPDACPFCPGHEDRLPVVLAEVPDARGGWRTRTVPNKYPIVQSLPPASGPAEDGGPAAVSSEPPGAAFPGGSRKGPIPGGSRKGPIPGGSPEATFPGAFAGASVPGERRGAVGVHEVIIESPDHDADLTTMSDEQRHAVIETYVDRFLRSVEAAPDATPVLFRNRGARSGASITHPHAQLIATPVVGPEVVRVEELQRRYLNRKGSCLVCDVLAFEVAAGERRVLEHPSFGVFVAYAARSPGEMWLAPRRHVPHVGELTRDERRALGDVLGDVLRRLRHAFDDPDYNLVFHQPIRPAAGAGAGAAPYHWHLRIRPRLDVRGGFEMGSGVEVSTTSPEDDARRLREAATNG